MAILAPTLDSGVTHRRPATPSLALQVDGASRRLGGRLVLDRVDLDVPRGSILGVAGPNGAGKTSLIRAIAGRLRLDAGTVQIDGLAPAEARRRSRLGIVPQEIALYPQLTVRENLGILGRLSGLPSRGLGDRVTQGLAWAGLGDRASSRVATLSGGMRRRVNLVAGTLHDPALVLLDEPTVGVDSEARGRLHALLDGLRREGAGLLLASHDLEEVSELSDDVVVMSRGRIVARGSVEALIARTFGSGRELVVTITGGASAAARAALEADGFVQVGELEWARPAGASLAALGEVEERFATAGLHVVEARLREPSLRGAIAALLRDADGAAA